jgi:hypothetical protein
MAVAIPAELVAASVPGPTEQLVDLNFPGRLKQRLCSRPDHRLEHVPRKGGSLSVPPGVGSFEVAGAQVVDQVAAQGSVLGDQRAGEGESPSTPPRQIDV